MNMEQLQKENDELRANVERLRRVIIDATNNGAQLDSGAWVYLIDDSVINETPAQSMRHIESRVEEETRESLKRYSEKVGLLSIEDIDAMPSKYKEQSDEGCE